jgi:HK97 family phage major capsid protein
MVTEVAPEHGGGHLMSVIEELRERRTQARAAADEILVRAQTEERDLSAEELDQYQERVHEEREADERLEQLRDDEIKQLRAAPAREPADSDHPLGEWLTRAISGASGAGAALTPSEYPRTFFDKLSAQSVGLASGMQVVTTDRDSVVFPRWLSDTTAAWTSEAGTISSTDANADTVTATPRKLAALQPISNETLADSNPSLFEVVAAGLVRSLALKLDLGLFEGSGSAPEIRGLKNVASIQTVSMGMNGLAITNLDPIADALGLLITANANPSALVMAPRTWASLAKVKEVSGSAKPVLQDSAGSGGQPIQRQVYGVPVFLSSQLSITETQGTANNASSIYAYDATQCVVVQRQDVSVEIDRSRLFNSDQSEIRAISRFDLVVPSPSAVVRILGIIP